MKTATRILLAASVASALAVPLMAGKPEPKKAEGGKEAEAAHCYGVNKCKGVGDCGGATTSCMGTNACKHQGFITMDKEICLKLDGGRLTPNAK